MKYKNLHSWDLRPREAIELQKRLREQIVTRDVFREIRLIAGADIALGGDIGYAGVIVYSYPELSEVERRGANLKINFPYIPGLLAFREGPALLKAFELVKNEPDLVIFDGQGIAHPRGLGIASHMGLILDKPTIGCAKSHLFGEYEEPGPRRGEWSLIYRSSSHGARCSYRNSKLEARNAYRNSSLDNRYAHRETRDDGRDILGAVLRTRDNVAPVFISPGHKISLETSINIMMNCLDGYRIPRPTREADRFVGELKRGRSIGTMPEQ